MSSDETAIELRLKLPGGGQDALAIIDHDVIAVRIDGRVCIAHLRWMTLDEARAVAAAIVRVSR